MSLFAFSIVLLAATAALAFVHVLRSRATGRSAPRRSAAVVLAFALSGCVVYEPVPVDPMQQSWVAAMGAVQDAGLELASADQATGTVRGTRGRAEGIISVRMRGDGRVGVEITSRDPDGREPGLTQRLTDAYNRRMGR